MGEEAKQDKPCFIVSNNENVSLLFILIASMKQHFV